MKQLKKDLQSLVEDIRTNSKINMKEQHPLFKWKYDDDPTIEFQLMIREIEEFAPEQLEFNLKDK